MKKSLFFLMTLGIVLSSVPADAFNFSPQQLLQALSALSSLRVSGLPDEMSQYIGNLTNALQSSLRNGDLNLNTVYGNMGIPDLSDLEAQIEEAYQGAEQEAVATEGSNEATRAVTEQYSDAAFTEEGQQAIEEKQQAIEQETETVQTLDSDAQTETVTQNILKKIAAQNAQMALLHGKNATALTELNIKQDLANKNLANISAGIDSQNLAQNAQLDATLFSSMSLISQSTLRP